MSLPEEAHAASSQERIAAVIEREIEILRRLRPALKSRIDRASTLVVVHLANPRSRTVRVRIGAGGKPTFLVSSSSQGGVVYGVDPGSWECSCPDHHRRGAGCKHAICCYLLWRASDRPKGEVC
jgi:hypothetical protein